VSLETILPFLQPIEHIILDPAVSEVMVNVDGAIFSQRKGVWTALSLRADAETGRYATTPIHDEGLLTIYQQPTRMRKEGVNHKFC
jgi:hypothetical protein